MEDCSVPLTPEQARRWFEAAGLSISEWAQANGFKRDLVYSLLAGRIRGTRGDSRCGGAGAKAATTQTSIDCITCPGHGG